MTNYNINDDEEHFIVYGEWKVYEEDGECNELNRGYVSQYKTLEEAKEEYNKMIDAEKEVENEDYDIIYLDIMEDEDGDGELYQNNLESWTKPILIKERDSDVKRKTFTFINGKKVKIIRK